MLYLNLVSMGVEVVFKTHMRRREHKSVTLREQVGGGGGNFDTPHRKKMSAIFFVAVLRQPGCGVSTVGCPYTFNSFLDLWCSHVRTVCSADSLFLSRSNRRFAVFHAYARCLH